MAKERSTLIWKSALGIAAASVIAATAALAAEKVVIGLSQPNLGWPYIAAYTKAFQEAAAKQGNVEVIALSGADREKSEHHSRLLARR